MKNTQLRNHYIKTQKYLEKNPNDAVARESFNQFIMSLVATNNSIYVEVTNPSKSEDEVSMLQFMYEPKIKVDKRKKFRDNDNEFEEDTDFWQDGYER